MKIITLKFPACSGVRIRILGQFLTNKQRVLQVLGPMTQDIKHAVIDKWEYPYWPFALTLPIKKNGIQMHGWQWNGSFHHIALLVTSKLTSRSPLSQNVRGVTECGFKLDSAKFSEQKTRTLYFQYLFLILWVRAPVAWLALMISPISPSFIFQVSPTLLGTSYQLFLALKRLV